MVDRDYHFKITNQPSSKEEPKNRILRKIISFIPFLSDKAQEEAKKNLEGRIHVRMTQDGGSLVAQVKDLKASLTKELKKAGEFELLQLFESIVDPVIHEYKHLEKKLAANDTVHDKILDTYNIWVEKAKIWTAVTVKPFNKEVLVEALLNHITSMSDTLIRRDVKAIQEYATHELHHLGLSELTMTAVASLIDREASPHIQALNGLIRTKPMELHLGNVEKWKLLLNEMRAKHYNNALHAIDEIIESITPREPDEPQDYSEMESL